MKHYVGLFAFFIVLILGGCTVETPSITIDESSKNITLRVEEGVLINYQMTSGFIVVWESDDLAVASTHGNLIVAEGEGIAIITGSLMNPVTEEIVMTATIGVTVLPKLEEIVTPTVAIDGLLRAFVGENTQYTIEVDPISASDMIMWSTSNALVAAIDQSGGVQFISEGEVNIRATWLSDVTVYHELVVEVVFPSNESLEHIIVNADYQDKSYGDTVFYNNHHYNLGLNAFATISEALEAATSDSIIHLVPGTYEEAIRITQSNVRIFGPQANTNPNDNSRGDEAILHGLVTIARGLENIELNGLTFTDSAKVTTLGYTTHFSFRNNIIMDTSAATQAWIETADYSGGFLTIAADTKFSDQITIANNRFENLGDVGVHFSSMHNFKVLNNVFIDFSRDAIRSSTGVVYQNSQWLFMGNHFENSPYNGIFFRTYGPNSRIVESIISIFNNTFKNLGNTQVLYSSAISFRNYQEGIVSVNISYNQFIDCKNYILLRNNAVISNQENFTGYINYNVFTGAPVSYYFKNKNATDTQTTNPAQTNMDYNFFGDTQNNPINVAGLTHLFNGQASLNHNYQTALAVESLPNVYASNVLYLGSSPKMLASQDVSWDTSDATIATIDSEGVLTTHKLGTVVITATTLDASAYQMSFAVTIKPSIYDNYIYRLLAVAIGEEGYREGPNNYSKYGVWYGIPNGAWCAMFVSWSANEVGIPTSIIPKYASVTIGMNWFIARDLFVYKAGYVPKAGDIIFFKDFGASHTGIVIDSDATRVYTIEGNTSDQVLKRSYLFAHNTITGYGTPQYPPYEGDDYVFDISDATDGSGASTR